MKSLIILIILVLVAPFHLVFTNHFYLWDAYPSLLIIFAATLCLTHPEHHYKIWVGFATGTLLGTLSGANLSQYIVSFTLTAYLLHLLSRFAIELKNIFYILYIILWSIVSQTFLVFFAPPGNIAIVFYIIYQNALYNGFIGFLIYPLVKQVIKPKIGWDSPLKKF